MIQDYIRFCSEQNHYSEYDLNTKLQKLNDSIDRALPKTVDYYNEMVSLAENMELLLDKTSSKSALRVVLSYVKGMLQSNNVDKVNLWKFIIFLNLKIFLVD